MGKIYTTLKMTEAQEAAVKAFIEEKKDAYEVLDAINKEMNEIRVGYDGVYILNKRKKRTRLERRPTARNRAFCPILIHNSPFDDDADFKSIIGMLVKYIYEDEMMLMVIRYVAIKNEDINIWSDAELTVIDAVIDTYDWCSKYNYFKNRTYCLEKKIEYLEALEAFKEENKYSGIDIVMKNYVTSLDSVMIYAAIYKRYPFVEQLLKAGYENLVYDWINKIYVGMRDNKFRILLKPGKDIKSIIQLPKFIYEDLKENGDINMWDNVRLLNKKYKFTNESYQKLMSFGIRIGLTSSLQRILKMKFDGKPLYDLNSLMAYLARVDMYQAIEPEEALQILYDYMYMNLEMGVKPDTNSNSLKREHDVTTRNYGLVAKEIEDEKFREVVKKFKKYEYNNGKYCIIAPTSGQDLINEGRNNRNCVGSYINHIIQKRDMIFFMRRADSPDKSMITIEVSPNGKEIWQKYETANRRITDQDKLDFIDEWMRFVNKEKE